MQKILDSPAAPEALFVNGPALLGPGSAIKVTSGKAAAANHINYISQNTSSFLIMNGDKDELVSPKQSQMMHEALVNKGIASTYYVVKGAGHNGQAWTQDNVMNIIIEFLDGILKEKS